MRIDPFPPSAAASGPAAQPLPKATVAKFEGLFVREMLKAMRAAKLDDGLLDSAPDENWSDLRDQQFADALAAKSPIGLAAHLPGAKP